MRNLRIIAVCVLLLSAVGGFAQDMRSLFLNAPDSIFPLLTTTNREDCVDFVDAGMRACVTNRLGGKSELVSITPVYMHLKSSANSSVEMRLLPHGGDTLIAVARSVCAEACDSRLCFYDKAWNRVTLPFEMPPVKDFFTASDSLDYLLDRCDIYLVKLSLSPSCESMVAEYTMPAYMSRGDSALVAPKLRPIAYRWRGGSFVKE